MPVAVHLHRLAQRFLRPLGADRAGRLVLSLFFKAVLGIARVFHFDSLHDAGLAWLTGGIKVLSRTMLGGLVRAAPVQGVLRLVRATEPKLAEGEAVSISIDEHAVARFTRKFSIAKGYHTIRNKKMKVEKLFFPFDLGARRLVSLIVTRGNARLAHVAAKLLARIRRKARGRTIRVILDAGAAHDHAALLALVDRPRQVTLVRVPRRPAYRRAWEQLPAERWTRYQEPGPHTHAPPKIIHIAETVTALRVAGRKEPYMVRTIVVREQAGRGKERWHAIWVFNDVTSSPEMVVQEFRTRQHHEQRYRVLLHDTFVDTVPSGYNKKSRDLKRPGFLQNAVTLYSWIAGLATNALEELSRQLPTRWHHAHPRTLRRWLFAVPAEMYLGSRTLIVLLRPMKLVKLWPSLIQLINQRVVRIPWMENRRLILSLDYSKRPRIPEPDSDPP
jgi:hypothetical protein